MTSTPAQPCPIATFSNNVGFDVDIYDCYNQNDTPTGLLTYKKLATVPSGATGQQVQTIHAASQLQAMRTGNIAALNNKYYKQFPVAVFGVVQDGDSDDGSNTFTIDSTSQQGMEQSFIFIKYTQAFPASQLVTDFLTAQTDPNDPPTAVNTFFKGTGSFQQCTIDTWTAVMVWQTQFTSAWQNTYYLYSLGSSSTGSGTTSSGPALTATLVIQSSSQNDSATLTMASTNNQNTGIVLVGDGTMQEQIPGTGSLSVTLTPSWIAATQSGLVNGQPVITYAIGAACTGIINGVKVSGDINQLTIPSPSDKSSDATNRTRANNFSMNSVSNLVGMITSIAIVAIMLMGHRSAVTQKANDAQEGATTKEDAAAKSEQAREAAEHDGTISQVDAKAKGLESTRA